MSGKIKKIKLIFNNIDITYNDQTISSEILKIKQVEFGNLNVFNSGDRRDKINVSKMHNSFHYYKYNSSNDNTNGQTEYTLNIPSNTTADLLLVAGGGGGGCRQFNSYFGSGGGGAGGLVFELNKKLYVGTYTIKVGKGGKGSSYDVISDKEVKNEKGKNTEIIYNSNYFLLAYGGGEGGNRNRDTRLENVGKSGGSSGGSSYYNDSGVIISESVQENTINESFGNVGGSNSGDPYYSGGGGGGAGSPGVTGFYYSLDNQRLPHGGNGLADSVGDETGVDFKTFFEIGDTSIGEHHSDGSKVYFAGGGGGCRGSNNGGGNGGIGGGGDGEIITTKAENGKEGTGGGGGGGRLEVAGNGGSGIVIMRLKAEATDDTDLQNLIDNNNESDYEINLNNNNILIFNLNNDIDRKNILNSLNQIILKTKEISQINNLNYDVILENDEGEEILFETINETSPTISLINNNYSEYKSRYFNLFTEERLYPPYIFRDLPLQTNNIFTISNRLYGNGSYEIKYSSSEDTEDTEDTENNPLNIFKNDFSFTWKNNNYTNNSGLSLRDINSFSVLYDTIDYNINSYKGDWISIKLPNKIILTKFILVIKDYNNVTIENLSKFPLEFKIFGKNNDLEDVWKEIIEIKIDKNELNNIYNDQYFINSYYTRLHTYNYEGTNDYKEYQLVIENDFFCDILIVGGGGAGGRSENANRGGGGGGAGGLIYIKKIFLPSGIYNIRVGNGGQDSHHDGVNSSIIKSDDDTVSFIANGGGGGGNTGNRNNNTNGNGGGSGGGGADYNGSGGSANNNDISNNKYGNNGGRAIQTNDGKGGSGAGGGGADSSGENSNSYTKGLGGNGKTINISGEDIEYAKGGNGGRYNDGNGSNGLADTGNGGNGGNGAGRNQNRRGGKGGSGIVIIKQYSNYYNSYKHIFNENNKRLSGLEMFDEYALVINKIGGGTNVDFGTWEIYGKERFSQLNEVPFNVPLKRNIKYSHFYKVFEEQTDTDNSSNISIDDYINYIPNNINTSNLSFSTLRGLRIDSELPINDNILARYIPNNIYMSFSQDNHIIEWNDIYNNFNIIDFEGSPSIQKITLNSNGLYTDNERVKISTMRGTENDIIRFPFTLPENYTFCYIARYTGKDPNKNKRIFNSKNDKTYWCFNNDTICTSMYNDNIYSTTIKQISDNDYWIIGIETGDSMRYNGMDCTNYIYDSTYSINNSYVFDDTEDTNSITINGGHEDNKGSWEIGELIFYRKKLDLEEKIKIEEYFANRYYHISFTSIVQTIDDYEYIITSKYSINSDNNYDTNDDFYIWYNIYNGNKYAYSKINSTLYGPANYLFEIKKIISNEIIFYYWILFLVNNNQNNTYKYFNIILPYTNNEVYIIALGGGGSAGDHDNVTIYDGNVVSSAGNAGKITFDFISNINNNNYNLQIGYAGIMINRIGYNGGDTIISNNVDIINRIAEKGNKGADNIYNEDGEIISDKLIFYYNNYFTIDDIFNELYPRWNSDSDIQPSDNAFYGQGANGAITNDNYSGGSGLVAMIYDYNVNTFYTPLPFTDYLLAHYKCDSTSFVFSGTTITQWNDSSPNSNNITNYRGTPIQRTFTKGTKGTTSSGSFNTVYGDFNSGFKLPFTLYSNYTFCYVARYVGDKNNTTYNKRIFDSSSGIGENTWWGFNNNKTGISYNYKNNYYTTQHKQHSEPDYWMIGIETQNTARFNGQDCTNYYEYLDNFYPLKHDDYNANLTINYGFKTGDSGDNSEASNWEIAEMIFYNKELSEYEIKKTEQFLANKFSHISFSYIVTNLDSFKTIVTSSNYVNDLTDMWFYVYDGYKYSYNNVSGLFTGPVSFRFDLFKYISYPIVQTAVNDLFAWYKFDKDFTDSSGNGNDLVVGGGVPTFSLTDFVIGQSANFLNGNNWLKTYSFNFDGGNWCFALWVKMDSSSTDNYIIMSTPNVNNHHGGLIYTYNFKYKFYLFNASLNYNNIAISSLSYSSDVGNWVHLAVKQDSNGIIKIYRNGILIGDSDGQYLQPGLKFGYYSSYFNDNVNWFKDRNPSVIGYSTNGTNIGTLTDNTRTVNSANYYSFEWTGYFKADRDGTYIFYTSSDDASYLWIGENALSGYTVSNAIVNNGGIHGMRERSGSIELNANTYYPIRIQFGENTGGDNMQVYFTIPGETNKIYEGYDYYFSESDNIITSDFSGYSMDFGYFARGARDLFGLMDDFRWYQIALTDTEILDLYTQYSTNQYNSKYYWTALVSNNNTNEETDTYDNRNNNNVKCNIELANCTDDYFVHMVSLGGGGGGGKSKEDDTYRFSGGGGAGGLAYVSNKHIKNKIISIEAGSKGIGGTNILENSSGGDTTISWDYDNLVIGNGGYAGYDYGSNNLAMGGAYSGGDGGDYGGNSIYEEDKMHRLGGKISDILKNVILQSDYNLYDIINHNFIYWKSHNFVLGNDSSIYYGSGGIGARRNTSYDSNYILASNGGPGCAIVIIDFNDINTERASISIQKELKHKDYLINLVSYEARASAIEFTRALGGTSRSNYANNYRGYLAGNWNSTIIWIPVPKNYNCVVASGDNFIYATNIQIVRNATIDYTLTNGYTGGSAVYSNDVYGWRTHIYNNLKEGDIIKWYEGGSVIKKPYAIFLNVEQYVYNSDNDNGFGQTEYTLTFNEDTVCNVLIVAGGGGGGACQGYNPGGGGGAGEVLEKQVTFLASVVYIIKVGDGGDSSNTDQEPSKEGKDSGIFDINDNIIYHCKGGGRGGFGRRVSSYDWPATSGGSGGGAGRGVYYTDTSINYTGAPSVKYNIDGIGNDGRGWSGTQGGGGGGGELTFSSYLDFFYYDTYFNNDINWFQTNTHTSTGYTRYIQNIDNLTSNTVTTATTTSYSVEWFGYFKANRTGAFTFYLKSDDPAYLWIGENAKTGYTVDNALINNGSALVDNILEQDNSIELKLNNYYPFRLQFGKNTGNNIMELHFKLPTDTDTTRRYDNNGYIYRFIPEGRIGGNPYLSYIIKPTDEYNSYITNYLYYSYTSFALGGHGGYQYNQSFYNSLLTDTGNGGGGARAHRNNTTITAGQKGFSGIVIIDRNI